MQSYFDESPDSRGREHLNISLKQVKHSYVQHIVSLGNLLLQEELQAECVVPKGLQTQRCQICV